MTIDATGNRTINSPRFTGNATASYRIPSNIGDFTVNGTVIHKSLSYTGADNFLGFPAYTIFNASIDWSSSNERFGAQLWVKNLTDKNYLDTLNETATGNIEREADPRTYGITLRAKF